MRANSGPSLLRENKLRSVFRVCRNHISGDHAQKNVAFFRSFQSLETFFRVWNMKWLGLGGTCLNYTVR